jgi:hypothetical protein
MFESRFGYYSDPGQRLNSPTFFFKKKIKNKNYMVIKANNLCNKIRSSIVSSISRNLFIYFFFCGINI